MSSKKKDTTAKKQRFFPCTDDLLVGQEIKLKPSRKLEWPLFKVQRHTTDKRKRTNQSYLFERLPCKLVGGHMIVYGLRVKGSYAEWHFPCPIHIPDDEAIYGHNYVYSPSCWDRQADQANQNQNNNQNNNKNSQKNKPYNNKNNNKNNNTNDDIMISIIEEEQDLIEPPSKNKFQSKNNLKKRKDDLLNDEQELLTYESIREALTLIEPELRTHSDSKKNNKKRHWIHPQIKDCIHTLNLMKTHFKPKGIEPVKWKKLKRVYREILDRQDDCNSDSNSDSESEKQMIDKSNKQIKEVIKKEKVAIEEKKIDQNIKQINVNEVLYCDPCKQILKFDDENDENDENDIDEEENSNKRKKKKKTKNQILIDFMRQHHKTNHSDLHYRKCKHVCYFKSKRKNQSLCLLSFSNKTIYKAHKYSQHSGQMVKQRQINIECIYCKSTPCNISYNGKEQKYNHIRCIKKACGRRFSATDAQYKIIKGMKYNKKELKKILEENKKGLNDECDYFSSSSEDENINKTEKMDIDTQNVNENNNNDENTNIWSGFVKCPLCGGYFPKDSLKQHMIDSH